MTRGARELSEHAARTGLDVLPPPMESTQGHKPCLQDLVLFTKALVSLICVSEPMLQRANGAMPQCTGQAVHQVQARVEEVLTVTKQRECKMLTICVAHITHARVVAYKGEIRVSTPEAVRRVAMLSRVQPLTFMTLVSQGSRARRWRLPPLLPAMTVASQRGH